MDIVKALRDVVIEEGDAYGIYSVSEPERSLRLKAANEIERLRDKNQQLLQKIAATKRTTDKLTVTYPL